MAKNIFTDELNNRELMDAFGINQENAPLTPEELADLPQQASEFQTPVQPVIKQNPPKRQDFSGNPFMEGVDFDAAMAKLPKEDSSVLNKNIPPAEPPMSKSEALIAEYNKLLGKGESDLAEARKRDRMLKIGGSIGDALATYLNAQSQMNVKAPGVQVQQGAGLGKVADMFATSPEIASDIATRRQDLLAQYKLLAMGKDGEKVYQTKSGLIKLDKDGKPIEVYSDPSVKRSLDISEKRLKQAEGRMDLSTTAEERRKEELQFKKGEANELKPKEMETLTGFDSSLDSLDRLEGLNKDFWTGPVEGRISQLSRVLGTDSGAKTKLAAQMEMVLSRYAKQISGTAVGEQEFERLRNQLPNETDSDAAFSAKFSNFRDELELSRNYGKIRDVEPFKERKSLVKKDENKKQTKQIIKRQYSPSLNKTKITYSDGTEERVDGKQQ
jgi:hypothetical protein